MENSLIPPGTVVVGIDGSHSSDRALDWAVDHALRERRQLTLAHGLDIPSVVTGVTAEDGCHILSRAREHVAERAPELAVHQAVWPVEPRVMLVDLADDASIVVVGSRGRGPVASAVLGSVSAAVAGKATCPVVVVRPRHPGLVSNGVLVGADGSRSSASVVEFAYRQASLRDLPLTILRCTDELAAAEPLSGLAEKFPEVRTRVAVADGAAHDEMIAASGRMNLVVVGTGGHARSVVEHAVCPVVVVPRSER